MSEVKWNRGESSVYLECIKIPLHTKLNISLPTRIVEELADKEPDELKSLITTLVNLWSPDDIRHMINTLLESHIRKTSHGFKGWDTLDEDGYKLYRRELAAKWFICVANRHSIAKYPIKEIIKV